MKTNDSMWYVYYDQASKPVEVYNDDGLAWVAASFQGACQMAKYFHCLGWKKIHITKSEGK